MGDQEKGEKERCLPSPSVYEPVHTISSAEPGVIKIHIVTLRIWNTFSEDLCLDVSVALKPFVCFFIFEWHNTSLSLIGEVNKSRTGNFLYSCTDTKSLDTTEFA